MISPAGFTTRHGDIVIIPLTGSEQEDDLLLHKWREAGLLKPTWLKPLIAAVTASLVEKSLGALHPDDDDKVATAIRRLVDSRFLSG